MTGQPRLSRTVYWIVVAFLFFPLFVLLFYSFNESRGFAWSGFSTRWYQKLFTDSNELWNSVGNSLFVGLTSAAVATVVGTLGAIGLNWYKFFTKKYIQTVSFIPLILPEIVIGVSLLIFFASTLRGFPGLLEGLAHGSPGWIAWLWYALAFLAQPLRGVELGMGTILIAHISFTLPFVILMVLARLSEFDYSIIEAARDLGAKETDILFRIVIPISMPGILSGFLTAFTLSLEDFVVTLFVQGPNSQTLPLYIYAHVKKGLPPEVNAFSVILIVFTMLLMFSVRNLLKYMVKSK
jgi:spermidine/putrescine transport system permease protein